MGGWVGGREFGGVCRQPVRSDPRPAYPHSPTLPPSHLRTRTPISRHTSRCTWRPVQAIADHAHSLGLHFGVWTIRGIPKVAVAGKWPIAGTNFTADQAVDPSTLQSTACRL